MVRASAGPGNAGFSRANRLSFGFASNTTIIPGEDPDEFRGLVEDFLAEHQPITVTEQVLVQDMNQPTFRLHRLKGNRKATWAIAVRANWRVTFLFEGGDAYDVDLEDYH